MSNASTQQSDEGFNSVLERIWKGDKLNRQQDAKLIHSFILGHLDLRENAGTARSFVLNLDSDWGSGKTFFLTKFQEELTARGHVAVYVNAWEDDHSDDPFIAVVTAVQAALQNALPKKDNVQNAADAATSVLRTTTRIIASAASGGVKQAAARYLGREFSEEMKRLISASDVGGDLAGDVEAGSDTGARLLLDGMGNALIAGFQTQKEARESFRQHLLELSEVVFEKTDKKLPVFVLIDELDRCRPAYAVELLERVKHLFSVKNFVFVLGSDTEQLSYAIQGLYGSSFDGQRYLNRFVDRTYRFLPTGRQDFVRYTFDRLGLLEKVFASPPNLTAIGFLDRTLTLKKIELRDLEQILELIATFAAVWPYKDIKIDLVLLVPYLLRKHLNVQEDEVDLSMVNTTFSFIDYSSSNPVIYQLEKMFKIFDTRIGQDTYVESPDEFRNWVEQRRHEIHSCLNDRKFTSSALAKPSNFVSEYPRLLETVARLERD